MIIPNIGKHGKHVTNHQPDSGFTWTYLFKKKGYSPPLCQFTKLCPTKNMIAHSQVQNSASSAIALTRQHMIFSGHLGPTDI